MRRFVLLTFFCGFIIINCLAQMSQDNPATFAVKVFAMDGDDSSGNPIPAILIVKPSSTDNGLTSVTLEIDSQVTAPAFRLNKSSLPANYQYLLGDDDDLFLNRISRGGKMIYDLAAPVAAERAHARTYDVTIRYASGEPATGIELESRFGMTDKSAVLLNRQTVPPDGRVRLKQPQSPVLDAQAGQYIPSAYLMLKATDPSGQTQTISFPQTDFKERILPDYDSVFLAMMPRETTATAFRGKVIAADGTPVAGTTLALNWLAFAGRGGESFNNATPSAITTAADGSFSLGIPQSFLLKRMGVKEVPTSATLQVRIPAYSITASLNPSEDNVIRTPQLATIRFQMRGADDNLVQTGRNGSGVQFLKVSPPNASGERYSSELPGRKVSFDPSTSIYSIDDVPVPGTYAVSVNGLRFKNQELNLGSVDNIVVFHQENNLAEVSGSILSAEDGAPVTGAFVISAFDGNADSVLIRSTRQDLEKALSDWEALSPQERNQGKSIMVGAATIFNVNGLTRTDEQGQFFMQFVGGDGPKFVHVYQPGRLGATCDIINNMKKKPGEAPVYELPRIYLPAAATVQVQVLGPEEVPGEFLDGTASAGRVSSSNYMVGCSFDLKDFRHEPPGMNSSKKNPWKLILFSGWQSEGNWPILPVPAGVKFSVTVSAPNTATLGYANWPDLGPLAAGDSIKLPEKRVSVKSPFLVNVKNADGNPAIGVSVRIDGALPLTTDSEGNVIGWSNGHVGRIEVMTDNTWDVAAEKRDVTVSSESVTRVELTLPD